MKTLIFLMSLMISGLSWSQTNNTFNLEISGRGSFACSAQAKISDRPVVARGETKSQAEDLAKQECIKQGNGFFCKVTECERDMMNRGTTNVRFVIVIGSDGVRIDYQGNIKYNCEIKAWGKSYSASAATRVEAKVITSNECANGNNGDAFFCQVKDSDCRTL